MPPFAPVCALLAACAALPTQGLPAEPQVQAANLSPQALEERIASLTKTQRWNELADLFETLGPRERGQRLGTWLGALKKAQRWERLAAVLDAAIPQIEGKGAKALAERLLRVTALDRLGRKQEAFEAAMEAGKLGSPFAWVAAGNIAVGAGQDAWLERAAEALCEREPKNPQGWAWKGECRFRAGRHGEAEPLLQKAVELDPRNAVAWINLGGCQNLRKAYAEAIQSCDRAIALDAALVQAHFNRALAHFGLRKYAEGREDMLRAQAQNPADPDVRARIAENLRLADRYLESRQGGAKRP